MHAYQQLRLMWKVRSLPIRPRLVCTIRCYKADKVHVDLTKKQAKVKFLKKVLFCSGG